MISKKVCLNTNLQFGILILISVFALAGCSESDSAPKVATSQKGIFYTDSTDLENRVARGCEYYWFGTGYFKLFVEKEASENEIFYMGSQFEKASEEFQEAIRIDESEGGYQYKRYINYRDLAQIIADTPNGGLKWSLAAENAHKELLKWCSSFNSQMQQKYAEAPDLDAEGYSIADVPRIP